MSGIESVSSDSYQRTISINGFNGVKLYNSIVGWALPTAKAARDFDFVNVFYESQYFLWINAET
jgi:hypothetical protein